MATNAEIAKAAGVSPAIVSRIVNGDPTLRVSPDTRKRVLEIVERFDYAPNIAARTLKAAQTGVIALVVHELTSSVYAEIIEGAHKAASEYGKAVLVGEAGNSQHYKSHLETLVAGQGVDGLILQGAGRKTDRTLARAARLKVPTVLLQTGNPENSAVLRLDDEAAGRVATEHLLDRGHRRIGFIGVSEEQLFSEGRRVGWQSALSVHGITPHPQWVVDGGNKFASGAEATLQILKQAPDLTGLVVANVVSAIGVLAKLSDLGRLVPNDFSVIAVHDIPLAEFLRPSLSVVKMPLEELGQQAVRMVCDVQDKQPVTTGLSIVGATEPIVIARQSTNRALSD